MDYSIIRKNPDQSIKKIMALTASTMLPLGTKAPDFHLPEVVSGKTISLDTFADKKALLVMFICRHCPFVKHIQKELAQLGKDYFNKRFRDYCH